MPTATKRALPWPALTFLMMGALLFGRRDSTTTTETIPQPRKQGRRVNHAADQGRGRSASSPWQIPWSGWKDILLRTYREITCDRLLAIAAGVVFYVLLAMIPAITALVSLYGLFADPKTMWDHLSFAAMMVPSGTLDLIREQIERIASKTNSELGLTSIGALLLALWSANAGVKAIIDALNVIYDEDEKRGFIWLNVVSLTITIGAIVFLLMAIASVVGIPLVLSRFGLESFAATLVSVLRWPLLLCALLFGLAVLYRYGPSREEARWQWVTPGSLLAAVMWLGGSAAFSWYLSNFADYNATYGSLGAAIGLMMWFWLTSIAILMGAELNAEIEHQTLKDTTTGRDRPLGARGATMADTVGAAQTG